jgi:proline iminopeptidase
MSQLRNFTLRLALTYIVLATIALLPGIQYDDYYFGLWIASFVFVALSGSIRPILLALTLPFTIMTAGLFIFVIDGVILLLTAWVTTLEIATVGWAIVASIVMSIMNIYVESAFKRFGWLDDDDDEPEEPPGFVLRLILFAGLLFGLVFSLAMGLQMALALSSLTDSLQMLVAISFVTFVLLLFAIATLIASGLHLQRRLVFGLVVTLFGAALLVIASRVLLFTPLAVSTDYPPPPENVRYWELPTGSRLAYVHYPAPHQTTAPPIIFVHGGPGWAVLKEDRAFYQHFADLGFDVYLYDQLGTGHSPRPDDMEGFTAERAVADLDAIRAELNSPDLILFAHGAGSEIAARYMAAFPERVREVVFHSPTPLTDDSEFFYDYLPTASPIGSITLLEPRPFIAAGMSLYGSGAAQSLVSQAQMSALTPTAFNPGILTCAGQLEAAPQVDEVWFNYYANILLDDSLRQTPIDLTSLSDNLTPVLILSSECDFVPWAVTQQYAELFPNERVFYFQDAGHAIHLTEPVRMQLIMRAFLLEEPYPFEPYTGSTNPRPIIPQP